MRITHVRIVAQVFFFSLFFFFTVVTSESLLKGYPVSLILEADPLVALATVLTTHSLYDGLLWSLVLLVPTLLIGRFFCNWICPYGILHHFIGWVFNVRNTQERIESNRYRPLFALKYYILIFMLVAAALGSLQIGLLDPIALLHRSFTAAVLPVLAVPIGAVYTEPPTYLGGWIIGFILFALLAANLAIPRFFCRVLCPLGALLGWLSRFSLWRIERDPAKCTDCDLCITACEGASDPHTQLRKSECFVCFNCIDDCPHDAISFAFLPQLQHEVTAPQVPRRRAVLATLAGVMFFPFARTGGNTRRNFKKEVIRPPGSLAEPEFLATCIKCDQCIRVCPGNVLQPAGFEAGVEGIWTPIMNMQAGYCQLNCVLCGEVCPTGAIQGITLAEKLGLGEFVDAGPVKTGTAFYDRGRCLPWAMDIPCVVCEEVCPTSPKAIFAREYEATDRWGNPITLAQPYVDPTLCIGCGVCEHECPVVDFAAIRVTGIGETRSDDRRLILDTITTAQVPARRGAQVYAPKDAFSST